MYPITYNFKRIALANKVTASDDAGNVILYAHQKMLKLREKILLYTDVEKTQVLGELNADKIIDLTVTQTFTDKNGVVVLKVRRSGGRSIWRAFYEVLTPDDSVVFTVREDKVWVKVMDALFTDIPIIGIFSGYLFNPKYNIYAQGDRVVGQIIKRPALMESNYTLELTEASADPKGLLPVATLTIITRERMRG